MSSSANTKDRNLPRLDLPDWLPAPVADEAKYLYGSAGKSKQTVDRDAHEPEQSVTLESTEDGSRGHCQPELSNSRRDAVCRGIHALNERHAEALRSMTLEQIELLCRLASDERMKGVWRELYRKARGSQLFLNPAKQVFGGTFPALHGPQNQDNAAREFFLNAFGHAAWPAPLMTRDDHRSRRKPFVSTAARLRKDAQDLQSLGLGEHAPTLEAIAMACEERAGSVAVHHPVITRSRGDDRMRGYVLRMNFICRMLFEKDLPGTVATTAGVAFSEEISGDQVRDMVRAYEATDVPTDTWLTTV
jgi:hypothetical protein